MIKFDKVGETPLDDISGLIPKITTRIELDSEEAKSISNAFLKYDLIKNRGFENLDKLRYIGEKPRYFYNGL